MTDLNFRLVLRGIDQGAKALVNQARGAVAGLGRATAAATAPARQLEAATAAASRAAAVGAGADTRLAQATRSAAGAASQQASASAGGSKALGGLASVADRATAGARRLAAAMTGEARSSADATRSADKLQRATRSVTQETGQATREGRRWSDVLGGLRRRADDAGRGMTALGRRLSMLGENPGFQRLEQAAGRAGLGVAKLTGTVIGLGIKVAAIGVGSLGGLGVSVIHTASKFEQFETVLTTVEGSAKKAKASMDWVQQFAAKTPYELDQVMDAFVRLRAYGIDPTNGTLRSLGDASSAMNKDVMAAVEMLADAQTGEFERLKEFGVRASQKGNQVTLTYSKAGKDIAVTTTKNASAIRAALLGIFDSRFKGAMDAQSRTFAGMFSNLKDAWTGFQLTIGRAGVFDIVKGELAKILALVNKAAADGSLARWAKSISASLTQLFMAAKGLVQRIDWPKFISDIAEVASGLASFFRAIGGLKGVIDAGVVGTILWLGGALMSLAPGIAALIAAVAGLAAIPLAPVLAVIAAITAAAIGGYLAFRHWAEIPDWIKRVFLTASGVGPVLTAVRLVAQSWSWIKAAWSGAPAFFSSVWGQIKAAWNGAPAFFAGVWERLKPTFKAGADALWNSLPDWLRTIFRGAAFAVRFIGGNLGLPQLPRLAAPPPPAAIPSPRRVPGPVNRAVPQQPARRAPAALNRQAPPNAPQAIRRVSTAIRLATPQPRRPLGPTAASAIPRQAQPGRPAAPPSADTARPAIVRIATLPRLLPAPARATAAAAPVGALKPAAQRLTLVAPIGPKAAPAAAARPVAPQRAQQMEPMRAQLELTVHQDGRPPTVTRASSSSPDWSIDVKRGRVGA